MTKTEACYDPFPMTAADPASFVCEALDRLGIAHQRYDHPPVFTTDEAAEHWAGIDATHCKNLFVRNKKGDRHCLIVAPVERVVDLVAISRIVGGGRLSFGSPERLLEHLRLTPGSVSPFGLLNDAHHRVELFLDAALEKAPRLAFHPNINTSTLVITQADFRRFLAATGHRPTYLALETGTPIAGM